MSFSVWFISLSIIWSNHIYFIAKFHSFLWLSNIFWYIIWYILYHIFSIHSSVDGRLDFFHILAVVNCAALNIKVHLSFWISVSFFPEICPGVVCLFWCVLWRQVSGPLFLSWMNNCGLKRMMNRKKVILGNQVSEKLPPYRLYSKLNLLKNLPQDNSLPAPKFNSNPSFICHSFNC